MRRQFSLPFVLFVLPLIGASGPAHHYTLDESTSAVSAKVAFFGLASKSARFPRISGQITLTPERLDAIDLDVTVDARALVASDNVTTRRLKGPKFFDVEHHPTVRFAGQHMTMTGDRTASVNGEITARGVTRPARLAVTFARPPIEATGREPIGLSATTTIDRRDFGMRAYGFIVGRKVTITINARMIPR